MDEVEDEEGLSRKARYCMKHDLEKGGDMMIKKSMDDFEGKLQYSVIRGKR